MSQEESKVSTDGFNHEDGMELYPITVLLEELNNGDFKYKIDALKRLRIVAGILGPKRTRNELIRFLKDTPLDEDEFLIVEAEELGKMVPYMGGPEYAYYLLSPLEKLASIEDDAVRVKAVESMLIINDVMPLEDSEKYFVQTIKTLTEGAWFTNRMSACSLYSSAYGKLSECPEAKMTLKSLYTKVCNDEMPMVRRAAVNNMANLASQMSREDVISYIIPLYKKLSTDCQDSVRLHTVPVYASIASILTPEEIGTHLLDMYLNFCEDKSWRIRYMVAANYISLAKSLKSEIPPQEICERFSSLLIDKEAEVRIAACSILPEFCETTDVDDVVKIIMPLVGNLVSDPSQHVRITLSERINYLSKYLGEEKTLSSLLPLLLHLLRDIAPEVRLNVISHLEAVSEIIGFKILGYHLLSPIAELASDKKWRVRFAIIQKIPMIAKQARSELSEILQELSLTWIKDPIYMIRDTASKNLHLLIDIFGLDWMKQKLFPFLIDMSKSPVYHHRLTALISLKTIFSAVACESLTTEILNTVIMLKDDTIPNVRVNVSAALYDIMPHLDENNRESIIMDEIMPVLQTLIQDHDVDVSYFSEIALKAAICIMAKETPPLIPQVQIPP